MLPLVALVDKKKTCSICFVLVVDDILVVVVVELYYSIGLLLAAT